MAQTKEINTQELIARFRDTNTACLDIRPVAAYNGWILQDESRGGHIEGAKSFPLEWTNKDEWKSLLKEKGVQPDQSIVVYGYESGRAAEMAEKLIQAGYGNVVVYNNFTNEWAVDETLPMDHLPKFKQLVYPAWVKGLINGEKPPHYDNDHYVICHASYGYREDYEAGHIPGAVHLDTLSLESHETWNRRTPAELKQTLLSLGIDHNTTVVMYGRFSHPNNQDPYPGKNAGHLGAIRCALILLYAGVKDVRILNGGLNAWQDAGFDTTKVETPLEQINDFGIDIPAHPDYIIDMPKAKELINSDKGELVSVRSWNEFIGDVSGYNYIGKVGRIPGAVFGNCGSDAYHMENYRNIDHTMREFHEIAANWAEGGIVPEKHIAFYCGTGWRASEAFFNAYLMNWPNISVFDGGWFEWSNDPENPVEQGVPA
jgi:thiosulfate/3-mercaptopyruvate sulfurtransferase